MTRIALGIVAALVVLTVVMVALDYTVHWVGTWFGRDWWVSR